MSNNNNEKLRQDIENINILNSTKAAMEAVGLPMEKFVAFNEAKAPVLFSKKPLQTNHGLLFNSTENKHLKIPMS